MTTDLFEDIEAFAKLPQEVKDVLYQFSDSEQSYENCELLRTSLRSLGYDCEYTLDAIPFNLYKIKTP